MNQHNREMFKQFAGSKVRITDESGENEIGIGELDEFGVVHATIDGEPYTQQLTHLVVGDSSS